MLAAGRTERTIKLNQLAAIKSKEGGRQPFFALMLSPSERWHGTSEPLPRIYGAEDRSIARNSLRHCQGNSSSTTLLAEIPQNAHGNFSFSSVSLSHSHSFKISYCVLLTESAGCVYRAMSAS